MGHTIMQFETLHNPEPEEFLAQAILLDAKLLESPIAQAQQIEIELIKIWRQTGHPSVSTLLLKDE